MQCNGLHEIVAPAFVHLLHNMAAFVGLYGKPLESGDANFAQATWEKPVFMRM